MLLLIMHANELLVRWNKILGNASKFPFFLIGFLHKVHLQVNSKFRYIIIE